MQPDDRKTVERRMDELAREYAKTHDKKIITEMLELSCRLRRDRGACPI
jgi:hypothetical protein